jgi:UDP-N-acetylglucosamine 3-dehydrogenase
MTQAAEPGADRTLRVGVVGVGVMGSNHARVFAGLPDIELVGVADPDRKQADFVARTLGCAAVADVAKLLDMKLDAITIAAPTHLHRDIALACIARGVHVMVEKPIASSVEEGNEIISAARKAGLTLMVGHVERFNPAVEAIKDAIRSEDILSIAITRVGPFPPRMSNVGVVIDLAVHDIGAKSKIVRRPLPENDPHQRQPDISLAKKHLSWEPRTQLKEGLTRTIGYFEKLLAESDTRAVLIGR